MNEFKNKVVVVTGGARGIGRCIAEEFQKEGAKVYVIDILEGDHYVGDISDQKTLEQFAQKVIDENGKVDVLVNNAIPLSKGIDECSFEEFQYALNVGVTAPFYLSKLFNKHFSNEASIINISSSRDRMSQPQTESYTAAKGGIAVAGYILSCCSTVDLPREHLAQRNIPYVCFHYTVNGETHADDLWTTALPDAMPPASVP